MILFVTGTDTGVGKTVASAWLALREQREGRSVRYVKPLQTGLGPGEAGSDADLVAEATGIPVRELMRLRAPLAPLVAARLEHRDIDVEALARAVQDESERCDTLIVEGAGGILVPITETNSMADFAVRIGARAVVVARPSLGTLNHTALTLEAAARRNLPVAGIVISAWPEHPDLTHQTNLEELRAHGLPVDIIPFREGAPQSLARA